MEAARERLLQSPIREYGGEVEDRSCDGSDGHAVACGSFVGRKQNAMQQDMLAPVRMPATCAHDHLRGGVLEQTVEVARGFMTRDGMSAEGEHSCDDIRTRSIEARYAIHAARNAFQSTPLDAFVQERVGYAGRNELPARDNSVLRSGKAQDQRINFGRPHA